MINWPNHRMFVYLSVKKLKFKTSKETCARATMAFSEFTTELSSCEMTWFDCDSFPISPGHHWPEVHQSTIPFLKANELKKNVGSRSDSAYLSVRCVLACLSRKVSIEGKFPAKWNRWNVAFLRWETVGEGPTGWRSLSGGFSEPCLGICGYFQEKEILRNLETQQNKPRITNEGLENFFENPPAARAQHWCFSKIKNARFPASVTKMRLAKVPCLKIIWVRWNFHEVTRPLFASISSVSDFRFQISPKCGALTHCAYRPPCLQVQDVLRNLLIKISSF